MAHKKYVYPDRISELPVSILDQILGLLPILEAVRTSVLSKPWRDVWKSSSSLRFDDDSIEDYRGEDEAYDKDKYDPIENTRNLTTRVFSSHYGVLDSCEISYCADHVESGEVLRWIEESKVRKTRDLNLVYIKQIGNWGIKTKDFPSDLFRGHTLHALALTHGELGNALAFRNCTNLTSLHLKHISLLGQYILDDILTNCLLLEKLTIHNCIFWKNNVKIVHNNIKTLDLRAMQFDIIEICSYSLSTLVLHLYEPVTTLHGLHGKILISTPNLRCFSNCRTEGLQNPEYYRNVESAEILDIYSGLYKRKCEEAYRSILDVNPFASLCTLSILLNLKDIRQAYIVSYCFRLCPLLQNLYIKQHDVRMVESDHECLPYSESSFWERQGIPDCISHGLRRLVVQGFKGNSLEFSFVKYVLAYSCDLEKIIIQCRDDCLKQEASVVSKLLTCPKASTDVSIALRPGPSYLSKENGNFETWVSTLKTRADAISASGYKRKFPIASFSVAPILHVQ
ncbi:hypothetical protein ACHQM5_017328 [Ranunculus cassubicifolius]